MENVVGKALGEFDEALRQFRRTLSGHAILESRAFEGSKEWIDLLTYKLVPHMAGEGCLVAAVTGGTNTGKSTVFNLLLGQAVSPMVNTAAATCHPVLAAGEARYAQCMESKLVPEFDPRPLSEPELATDPSLPESTLLVALAASLPGHLVIMDTPDVDSIEKRNWAVADHIRAAGDVIVAVVTAEKYKDERVVTYFREAVAASRVVIPLMNKANPAGDFDVARKQLDEFRADVGTDEPRFVVGHDFNIGEDVDLAVQSLDGAPDLRAYLEGLDVHRIKEQVYRGTVARFGDEAGRFLERAAEIGAELRQAADRFEVYAERASQEYDPAPGKEVGGLFHEFVQSKRGAVRRAIGNTSATVVRGAAAVGRRITSAFRQRTTLEAEEEQNTDEKLVVVHRQSIERITRNLATRYIEAARDIPEPAKSLIGEAFENLDVDALADAVVLDAAGSGSVSDDFRRHANGTLEAWWRDHAGKRRALEALDTILAVMPAAIAAPIALHTGGIGVSEAVVFAGPLAAQFLSRVMEYQFGDALFDFLSPWKREQQETLKASLMKHVSGPALGGLHDALEAFEGETMDRLERSLKQCLEA